jgi:hypothetical protein
VYYPCYIQLIKNSPIVLFFRWANWFDLFVTAEDISQTCAACLWIGYYIISNRGGGGGEQLLYTSCSGCVGKANSQVKREDQSSMDFGRVLNSDLYPWRAWERERDLWVIIAPERWDHSLCACLEPMQLWALFFLLAPIHQTGVGLMYWHFWIKRRNQYTSRLFFSVCALFCYWCFFLLVGGVGKLNNYSIAF